MPCIKIDQLPVFDIIIKLCNDGNNNIGYICQNFSISCQKYDFRVV